MTSTKALSADTRALAVDWVGQWFDPFVAAYTPRCASRQSGGCRTEDHARGDKPNANDDLPSLDATGPLGPFLKTIKLLHAVAV